MLSKIAAVIRVSCLKHADKWASISILHLVDRHRRWHLSSVVTNVTGLISSNVGCVYHGHTVLCGSYMNFSPGIPRTLHQPMEVKNMNPIVRLTFRTQIPLSSPVGGVILCSSTSRPARRLRTPITYICWTSSIRPKLSLRCSHRRHSSSVLFTCQGSPVI